ncbi:hypothetical protein [Variovorax ginsengisoli]|uniref:Uncharacterized protein n=1 Tax=Variovorax ginsengisoli TaxID=363844 RepID=A0ABT9SGC1_9BURK|nr:hypothetical protein [Variovorax ginsengisoli]MDP9902944.1 hypothetical protein [Variovorax ginsengisoli]
MSRKSVTIWKDRGELVMDGNLVDFEASYKGERWHASTKKVFADDAELDAAREPARPAAVARGRRAERGAPVTLSRGEVVLEGSLIQARVAAHQQPLLDAAEEVAMAFEAAIEAAQSAGTPKAAMPRANRKAKDRG